MKQLLAVIVGFSLTLGACRGDGTDVSTEGVVASIDNISPALQQKEDLRYTLLCAKSRQAALTEIDTVDIKKGALSEAVKLQFQPKKPVQSGDFCRVEVRGVKDAVYGSQYEFQVEKDLFYSSTKGEVIKGEGAKYTLLIKIYKVFLDLKEETRAVNAEVSFPTGVEGKFALELLCEKKTYLAQFILTKDSGSTFKGSFTIPFVDYGDAAKVRCTGVKAVHDNKELQFEAKIEPALEIAKVDKTLVKVALLPVVVPGTKVETQVEKGECAQGEIFNPVTEECEAKNAVK